MKYLNWLFYCFIMCFVFPACGVMRFGENATSEKAVREEIPPLEVNVSQDFVVNDELHVKLRLFPKTELAADEVVVELVGLYQGELVEKQIKKLSDIVDSPVLEADEPVMVSLALPSLQVSEYQVRCAWGKEARSLVAKLSDGGKAPEQSKSLAAQQPERVPPKSEAPKVEQAAKPVEQPYAKSELLGLTIKEIKVSSTETKCKSSPCDLMYTIGGTLANEGQSRAAEISLALGLKWVDEGAQLPPITKSNSLEQDEQEVSLTNVILDAGQTKKLELSFDRPVPVVPGGRFMPTIRVLKYQQK